MLFVFGLKEACSDSILDGSQAEGNCFFTFSKMKLFSPNQNILPNICCVWFILNVILDVIYILEISLIYL
jgi:hypothetical protein